MSSFPGTKIIQGKLLWCDKKTWLWPVADRHRLDRSFRDGPGDLDGALPMLMPHLAGKRACIQAGGCLGIWPVRLSQFFDTVFTFEPERINFECLTANTSHLDNVVRTFGALGECEKFVKLKCPEPSNPGTFYVQDDGEIPMTTIDSHGYVDVDLIYLDVEGYEVEVLRGAKETIERCRPVIGVEDYPSYLPRYGLPNVVDFLVEQYDYRLIGRPEGQLDAILAPR